MQKLPEEITRKRPSKGYNSEKERDFNAACHVSDWEVYHNKKYIGVVYKSWSWTGNWSAALGDKDNEKDIGNFMDMNDAVFELQRRYLEKGE